MMRLLPHRGNDGEVDGLRLYGIRSASLPLQLGFRNGDILHTINNAPITNTASLTESLTALADRLQQPDRPERIPFIVTLTRRGEPMTVTVDIVAE